MARQGLSQRVRTHIGALTHRPARAPAWLGIGLATVALAGCFGEAPPNDFLEQPLAGRIDGRDWKYKHAYIDPTLNTPNEDDVVLVFLPYKPKMPCPKEEHEGGDTRRVLVAAPKEEKLTKIKAGTPRNLTFQYTTKNGQPFATSAKTGKIKLTSIDTGEVKGKLFALTNDGHWVSGTFSAVVCNSMDFK